MRVRTDQRRLAILEKAAAVFREVGYERASMAQIAARVGGSKTTLYGYYQSKQELFAAVMLEALQAQSDALTAMLDAANDDLRRSLTEFARAYLNFILSPEIIAITRIGIADADANGIGPKLYAQGPGGGLVTLAGHIEGWTARGLLRDSPPATIAGHLRALIEAGVVEPILYGIPPAGDHDSVIDSAIDAFIRAYGTDPESRA